MKTANPSGRMLVTKTFYKGLLSPLKRIEKLKYGVLASVVLLICSSSFAQTVALIEISGQVVNQEKNEPLGDVSVQIKGSVTGTITDNTGTFILRTKQKLPFTLVFSSVGFQPKELEVKSLGSKLQV